MKHRMKLLGALALSTLALAIPHKAEAGVNVYFGTAAPTCQNYTRTYTDIWGSTYYRNETACLQPNGVWQTVSQAPAPVYYSQPVVYRTAPVVYRSPVVVYKNNGRRDWNDHDNRRDNRWDHHDNNQGRGHR